MINLLSGFKWIPVAEHELYANGGLRDFGKQLYVLPFAQTPQSNLNYSLKVRDIWLKGEMYEKM